MSATSDQKAAFFSLVSNPFKFNLFLLKNLPAAYFSGLKLEEVSEDRSMVSIPFKWFSKNPFRSTYFACLSMAAEMSTGVLAMANVYKRDPKISMLVVAVDGKFYKKATGLTRFICTDGLLIKETVEAAIRTGEPQSFKAISKGYNEKDEPVADFWVTWGFRVKGAVSKE